ncbi:beta-propeller fold lactonase family protein [Microbacterium sp. BK668]|uniref:lactonase family protein n=1 Tax=Microbacterium sp. BK668 TaxID=2512118 RepID=UPI0010608DA6|nr:beta-propeller fold lactonase family protein [Microbacterium sp. BK668]TDN91001.1 6-phosphogluconolactonase (cycloisomerase 2 family) [Microbacterium sp. BK668]
MRFWLGGYSADMGGSATGIGILHAGAPDAALAGGSLGFAGDAVATGGSPSWVTAHPALDVVYAALEGAGTVQAFRRTGEASFIALGDPVEAGEAVCHIAVAPDGSSLVASCWGDGRVVRMTTDASGRPSAPAIAPSAADPYGPEAPPPAGAGDLDLAAAARALREAAGEEYAHLVPGVDPEPEATSDAGAEASRLSHAHQAIFLPRGVVATTDMGFDLVRFWRSGTRGPAAMQDVVLPRGSGPRHAVWHPSGHLYVVTELSHEVFALAPDEAGAWRIVAGTPLAAGIPPEDTAAEIASSRDGRFLYAGVRGSDTIAVLGVRGEGDVIQPTALVEAGVHWPRHHVVMRDDLLVAGQLSEEVASLGIDLRTGVPGRVRHRTPAPSPTCIVPAR